MITINNYEDLQKAIEGHAVCLVKIGASWCGPCKVVQKNIESIEELYPDVYFIDVEVDEAEDIVEKFDVRGVPVIIIFVNGNIISKTTGLQTKSQIEEKLNKLNTI